MMIDRALGFVSWLLSLDLRFVFPLFSPGKENIYKKRNEKGIYKIRRPTLLPQDGGSVMKDDRFCRKKIEYRSQGIE